MLESKLDIPHSRFQDDLSELSEPCSSAKRVTVPLLESEENCLNHRSPVIDVIIMASVVCFIKRIELPMFNHWSNVGLPKLFTQDVPVIPFVSGNGL